MWILRRLLMCVYLSLNFPVVLTVTVQRCLCTGWGQWQLGEGDNMVLFSLLLVSLFFSSFTTIITAFVPSSSHIKYNFVRCYRKTLQNETVRKGTIVEYKTSDSKFHIFEKIYLLWTVMLEGSKTVLIGQKVHSCSSVTHQECRAFFYRERAFIQV